MAGGRPLIGGTAQDSDPYWSSVELLLHMDGANGSTDFIESKAGRTPSNVSCTTSADRPVFGSASLKKAAGGHLYWPRAAWTDGLTYSQPWTFEARVYIDIADTGDSDFGVFEAIGDTSAKSAGLYFQRYQGNWYAYCYAQGSNTAYSSAPIGAVANKLWFTVRLVCDGTALTLLINGSPVTLSPFSFTGRVQSTRGFLLGTSRASVGSDSTLALAGYIDEVRFTRSSRGTLPYTVDTAPFPDS